MAYQTYITEALVCGSFDHQTSDRSFLLFTREAGMLLAHAKSVREERSKHRYALQVCSHIRVTLVRGKTGWRITGTESLANMYTGMKNREARALLRNIVLLMRRVIHGESIHSDIFDDVMYVLTQAEMHDIKILESLLAIRMLHTLGYVAPNPLFTHLLHVSRNEAFSEVLSAEALEAIQQSIAHALMQSHL